MNRNHMHVEVEATNICNTRCLHCPHEALSRPFGKMDWETYQTVIDKAASAASEISVEYAGMGEPLLNPLIYQFIQYAGERGVTSMTTNASALTEKNAQRLVEAGLNHLTISFNGDDQAIYELMMGGLSFERAQNNLRSVLEISRGTGLEVRANVSVTRQTQTRLDQVKSYLNEAGIEHIYFSKCHSRGGFLKGDVVCNTPPPPVDRYRCDIFANTLFVAWTGEVLSCCHDLAGANVIGDLKTEALDTILKRKVEIESAGVKFEICKNCNDLYRFMNDQTPDGLPISQWVYRLYSEKGEETPSKSPSLSEWMYDLYLQENEPKKLFRLMDAEVRELRSAREREVQELRTALQEIHSSRSWRFLVGLKKLSGAVMPPGSRAERTFQKALEFVLSFPGQQPSS